MAEHTFPSEYQAREFRRELIEVDVLVSLIALDEDRGLYVFDSLAGEGPQS